MLFANDEVSQVEKKVSDGRLDYSKTLYASKAKETRFEFALLRGHNKETMFTDADRIISHSVKDWDKKIECAKRLRKYKDNDGKEKFSYDSDSWIPCDHCKAHEDSRPTTDKGEKGQGKDAIKSIEILVPVMLFKASYLANKMDGENAVIGKDGKPIKEMVEEEVGKPAVLAFPIGDAFFKTAASGVSKDLSRLWKKDKLKNSKLVWTYGEIDEVDSLSKDELKVVENLRKTLDLKALVEPHLPMSYADYYEKAYGEKYIYPLDENGFPRKDKQVNVKRNVDKNVLIEEDDDEDIPY